MTDILKNDLPFIAGKYHKTDEPFDFFSRMKYHGWEGDPSTGLDDAAMHDALAAYVDSLTDAEHAVVKAKAFAFVLDHMRIGVNEHDWFPLLYNWNRPLNFCTVNRWHGEASKKFEPSTRDYLNRYSPTGDITSWIDYDHAVPDWQALYTLGWRGVVERAEASRKAFAEANGELTAKQSAYFDSIVIEYEAIIRLTERFAALARAADFDKAPRMADCLTRLAEGAPAGMYDRMMMIYLYFMLSESVDSYQVRSLGSGIDFDLAPGWDADLAAGRFTEEELTDLIGYFLYQWQAIGNYWGQPMYLGGINRDGTSKVSAMTFRILSVYDRLNLYNPKVQVKYSKADPPEYLDTILDMVRRGHTSFVFICDENIRKSFASRGIPFERYYDYDMKGCYEYALRGGEFSTGPLYINLLGPVVSALNDAEDGESYETFETRYFRYLADLFEGGVKAINDEEQYLDEINPAPMLSGTITTSLACARDAYQDGAELDTTVFIVGSLGSAADALTAVRIFVWDEKLVTLSELRDILKNNWSDASLRAKALALPKKFGCGDKEVDALAAKISDFAASYQGTPNSRGGYWKTTMHSARQYLDQGRRMPATPDGRLAGEELSKNASPVQGMDRRGVTALIRSALAVKPSQFTEGFGFDVMLHESAVKGDDGLAAMRGLLLAYDAGGGASIQFNVFSAETLRDAQAHPEKYRNLQIRVCGWNILWNEMAKSEQEKFIERAENLQ